jgi:energy-coupling factor transporter transmembrane protein EcfT
MKFLNFLLKLFIFLAFTSLNAQEKFLFSGEINKKPIKVEISFKGNNNASGFLQDFSTKEKFPKAMPKHCRSISFRWKEWF